MSQLNGVELSKKVAKLYDIEARDSKFWTTGELEDHVYENWLHEDSERCFELSLKHGIHYYEFPYHGGKKICTNIMNAEGTSVVEVDIKECRYQAARDAILLSLLAMKESTCNL